jgi:hypothetical protein
MPFRVLDFFGPDSTHQGPRPRLNPHRRRRAPRLSSTNCIRSAATALRVGRALPAHFGYNPLVRRIIGCRIPHSMRRFLGQLNLGQPAYPRPKGTGDQSMTEKRRQARSASRTLRKTRVAWSRLDCLKSNPDRDSCSPLTRGWNPQADSVRSSRVGLMQRQTRQVRTMRYQEIDPGRRDEWTT